MLSSALQTHVYLLQFFTVRIFLFFFSASVIVVYSQSSHKETLCSEMKPRVKNGHLSTAENRPKYNLLPNFMGTAPNQPFLLLFHRKHNYLLTK